MYGRNRQIKFKAFAMLFFLLFLQGTFALIIALSKDKYERPESVCKTKAASSRSNIAHRTTEKWC